MSEGAARAEVFPSTGADFERPIPGNSDLARRIRAYDWHNTSLGPPDVWPKSLRTAVGIMLTSRQPIWIGWGRELVYLYNDPDKSIIGGKHPWALGKPVRGSGARFGRTSSLCSRRRWEATKAPTSNPSF